MEITPAADDGARADSSVDWMKVRQPRDWQFPRDHAAHPDHHIEWWYYTGNLTAADGRPFGFQLTFFRTGLDRSQELASRWAVDDLYTAHFALSDIQQRQFYSFEQNNRAGIGWAGVAEDPVRVWNAGWELVIEEGQHRLRAAEGGVAIELVLRPTKPLTLHHGDGLSQKGPSTGNASHYYSFTRLATEGTVSLDGQVHQVQGYSWMDHEFSSSFLEPGQAGWDWFALQLDDGSELMIYQIRDEDGRPGPFSSATWVPPDGDPLYLAGSDFQLLPGRRWESSASQGKYPVQWQVRVPRLELDLQVEAAFPAQEMNTLSSTGIIYWEGAITIGGSVRSRPVSGRGYLEMTGYSGQGLGRLDIGGN